MTAILIGYARCSTGKQGLEANRQILLGLGVNAEQIYLDGAYSGSGRAWIRLWPRSVPATRWW